MAREYYGLQLKELKNQMLLLGSMVEGVIEGTVSALVSQDIEKAKEIAAGDDKVDRLVRQIEEQCYSLLLRQQPVAGDLREVSAALKMITDMERIGDHGTDISELTVLMGKKPYPDEIRMIEEMSKEAMVMLMEAVDAFAQADAKKAGAVIEMDDIVDELFLKIKGAVALSVKTSETDAEQELDLLMTAKYFERIGDHATNIAEWVLFGITGELPED